MSTPVEQVVRQLLLEDPVVASAVGDRVVPVVVPEGVPLPAITFARVSRVPVRDLGGVAVEESRLRLTVWAPRYGQAKELAERVTAALTRARFERGGTVVADLVPLSAVDEFGADAGVWGVTVDVRVVQDV